MSLPDYFELYQLPQTLHPDVAAVRRQYYALSRQYHPDRAAGTDAVEALRMSALVNDAYKTLTDPDRTMGYVLRLHGVVTDEEQYALPPAFLLEVMELNEAIGNAAMAPDMQSEARQEFTAAMGSWSEGIAPFVARFDAGERTPELFAALKDFYYRNKYLQRLSAHVDKLAPDASA